MKYVTFAKSGGGQPAIGVLLGDRIVNLTTILESVFPDRRFSNSAWTLRELIGKGGEVLEKIPALVKEAVESGVGLLTVDEVVLLPPIPDPDKFICVGKNYPSHLEELRQNDLLLETPDEPTGFLKLNSAMVGQGAEVARPLGILEFDYEPEMVFVIGREAFQVDQRQAMEHVFGITVLNDLTAREIQKREVRSGTRFWTAKNMPGFAPVGPCIVSLDEIGDPYDLTLICEVNGEVRMKVPTRDQIFKIPQIIEHFSRWMPLQPGDMFSTGAPGGVALGQPNAKELYLKPGDVVECGIDGYPMLKTKIIEKS